MSELNETFDHNIPTEEEITEWERQRKEMKEMRLAPFKALRQRMDAGLRYAVANDAVTDEELLTMADATHDWVPNISLFTGDTVMYDGAMFVVIQDHTTQTGWEPGTTTQSLYRRVKREGNTEWQPDTDYKTGEESVYADVAYICKQDHTSQIGWEPPNVPSLWEKKAK